MSDILSVIIPARNEEYLQKTIDCVLEAAVEDIEVIAVCDGYWPDPPLKDHPSVVVLHYTESIGQRGAINQAARIAKGKYIMKLDAHCSVGPGFDKILKEDCEYEWTMVPRMHNLDIKTFTPKFLDDPETGLRKAKVHDYMYIGGPSEDPERWSLRAMYYGKYAGVVAARPKSNDKLIDETMCLMGPCWFMHKDKFFDIECFDDKKYTFFQEAQELGFKVWLSGGRVIRNKKTWYAHMHKGQKYGSNFGLSKKKKYKDEDTCVDFWMNNRWHKQTRQFKWLIDKFMPLEGWPEDWAG